MDHNRKKELKMKYQQMKHPMGIYIVRSKKENKCFIETAQNLKAKMNGTLAKLLNNYHPNLELQKAWQKQGEENFTIDILEYLEYDKDESKTDYSEELAVMQMIWEEKLANDGMEFYQKRLKNSKAGGNPPAFFHRQC